MYFKKPCVIEGVKNENRKKRTNKRIWVAEHYKKKKWMSGMVTRS